MLKRWPGIVWKIRIIEDRHYPKWGQGDFVGRARVDYEFGAVWEFFQSSRWEPLKDLHKLNEMEVIAMAAQ